MQKGSRSKIKNPIQQYNNLSEDQSKAKKVILNNDITCLLGRAGSGKTHLATICALEKFALERKHGGIDKIIITRPTIARKEDNIGFLPGDIGDKYDPWVAPIKEILHGIEGIEKTEGLIKDGHIQVVPLMFTQGRTFTNSMVIIDEAQNLSKEGAEMIFTRLGKGSKMIFCGDPKQSLIDKKETGFDRLIKLSEIVKGLDNYTLTSNFRHGIVEDILKVF